MITKNIMEAYSSCGVLLNEKDFLFSDFYDLISGHTVSAIKFVDMEASINAFDFLVDNFESVEGVLIPACDIRRALYKLKLQDDGCNVIVRVGCEWFSLSEVKYVGVLLGLSEE